MKKLSVLLLLAVAVCVAPAAYAQRLVWNGPKLTEKLTAPLKKQDDMQKFGNKIIRQIKQAQEAYERQEKEQGKNILQDCSKTISFAAFSDHESQPKEQPSNRNPYFKGGDPHNDANYEKCRTCGEPITDERLYRHCPQDPDIMCLPAPKDASKNHTCYRCGKSFRPGQHCSAADYNAFCAKDAEQEKALEQAEQERQEQADQDSYCPKCGAEYSIDELYHGVRHTCHK